MDINMTIIKRFSLFNHFKSYRWNDWTDLKYHIFFSYIIIDILSNILIKVQTKDDSSK